MLAPNDEGEGQQPKFPAASALTIRAEISTVGLAANGSTALAPATTSPMQCDSQLTGSA